METFDVIILTGRPAAGKSEVIDYLKKCPAEERARRFHIGEFEEFDDFPYVWETFEVDDILERHGRKRLWTDPDYYFTDPFVWNLYIERINLAFAKRLAENPDWLRSHTAVIEFARGGENGIGEAMSYLSEEILRKAGLVYIKVSYEESVRKTDAVSSPSSPTRSSTTRFPMRRWSSTTRRTTGRSSPRRVQPTSRPRVWRCRTRSSRTSRR